MTNVGRIGVLLWVLVSIALRPYLEAYSIFVAAAVAGTFHLYIRLANVRDRLKVISLVWISVLGLIPLAKIESVPEWVIGCLFLGVALGVPWLPVSATDMYPTRVDW